jgi:uncharacterized protein YvpB
MILLLSACLPAVPVDPAEYAGAGGGGADSGDSQPVDGDDGDSVDSGVDSGGAGDGDSGSEAELEPRVSIRSPADGETVTNPVSFDVLVQDVAMAVLDADGYELGRLETTGRQAVEYTFSGTGYPRIVTLTGFDEAGNAVASDSITIEVEEEKVPGEVSLDVPYFYQYDNAYEPSSTCGITSGAMLVDYFNPGSVTPDSLYRAYGKAQGQSPDGLAAMYKAEGLHADYSYGGTRAELKAHLDAGRPVTVNGYWTGSGHVVAIVGYTATDWIVNDPAGDWYVCYGCGEADHVRYPMGGAWDDDMSWDGDIWYSTADTKAF